MSTSEDPRYRQKVFLDAYLTAANLTEDDDSTLASFMTAFGHPPHTHIVRIFIEKEVDLIYAILEPVSKPLTGHDMTTWGYKEQVPIVHFNIDKTGINGEELKWKAERELRRICEAQIFGSVRHLTDRTTNDQWVGPTRLYSTKWIMNYRREPDV